MIKQINNGCSSASELIGSMQEWFLNYVTAWNKDGLNRFIARNQHGVAVQDFQFKAQFFYDLFEQYQLEHSKSFGTIVTKNMIVEIPNTDIPICYMFLESDDNEEYHKAFFSGDIIAMGNLTERYVWNTLRIESRVIENNLACTYENIIDGGFNFNALVTGQFLFLCSVYDFYGKKKLFYLKLDTI